MKTIRLPSSKVQEFKPVLDDFSGGTNTVISEARLGKNPTNSKYAVESVNLQQCQDGIWETRPGLSYFGATVGSATSLDGASEYIASDDTRHLIVVGGGKVWKSINDGATWTELTGATFTAGYQVFFLQFKSQLWIANAHDPLAYYSGGSTLATYTALTDPASAPSLSRGSGLSTGSYTYYLRYTANNSIGYTNPSPALTVTSNYPRESWSTLTDGYIDYTLPAVTDAESYDLWLGDVSGQEYFLGSTATTTFRDTGLPVNIYRETPDDNTTGAPKFGPMELSGNRLWATKDVENPWRVYGTGTGQYLGYFSPFYGGFWMDLEKGGRYKPVGISHYRTGKGDPIITIFCSSPDGQGTTFQVELSSLTVGDVTFIVPVAYKLVGSTGSDASASVTKFLDNVGFINKKGVNFLRNKEQMFNILATDDMTGPVRNMFESLNESLIEKACGFYSPPRLMFSAAVGSENDIMFIFDLERRNWSWSWNVGFKQFFEYTDTAEKTRLLAIPATGTKLVEISSSYLSDFGEGFRQQYLSPLIPVDPKDHRMQAKIKEAIFELGNLIGTVSVAVLGKKKTREVSVLATDTLSSTSSSTGWGDDAWSTMQFSDTESTPTTFSQSSKKKRLRVNKKVYAYQYRVSSSAANTYWQLLSIQANGFKLPGNSPSAWD